MFQQDVEAVGGSLALSALCAAIPLLTLFVLRVVSARSLQREGTP